MHVSAEGPLLDRSYPASLLHRPSPTPTKAKPQLLIPTICLIHRHTLPITAIVAMETAGTGTRYIFTVLHRDEADF